jgi:hypothetical protein
MKIIKVKPVKYGLIVTVKDKKIERDYNILRLKNDWILEDKENEDDFDMKAYNLLDEFIKGLRISETLTDEERKIIYILSQYPSLTEEELEQKLKEIEEYG